MSRVSREYGEVKRVTVILDRGDLLKLAREQANLSQFDYAWSADIDEELDQVKVVFNRIDNLRAAQPEEPAK